MANLECEQPGWEKCYKVAEWTVVWTIWKDQITLANEKKASHLCKEHAILRVIDLYHAKMERLESMVRIST